MQRLPCQDFMRQANVLAQIERLNFGHSQRNRWETRCHLLVGLLSMLTVLSSDEAHLEYAVYSEGQ